MVTRGKSKKGTEGTDEEEMETIEEIIEKDAQGDQPENPIQDREWEQQAGDTIENPPDKVTPTQEAKIDLSLIHI